MFVKVHKNYLFPYFLFQILLLLENLAIELRKNDF
jgi:hypothetical protein